MASLCRYSILRQLTCERFHGCDFTHIKYGTASTFLHGPLRQHLSPRLLPQRSLRVWQYSFRYSQSDVLLLLLLWARAKGAIHSQQYHCITKNLQQSYAIPYGSVGERWQIPMVRLAKLRQQQLFAPMHLHPSYLFRNFPTLQHPLQTDGLNDFHVSPNRTQPLVFSLRIQAFTSQLLSAAIEPTSKYLMRFAYKCYFSLNLMGYEELSILADATGTHQKNRLHNSSSSLWFVNLNSFSFSKIS